MSDLVSSVYTLLCGLSMLLFPIIGSFLSDKLGFSGGMEIVGLALLLSSALYSGTTTSDLKKEKELQISNPDE